MGLRPENWSREQAERFKDHVVEREQRMLCELATWMRATDGPIEAMDASVDSLVDYWGWFIEFADRGTPGVPPDAMPSMWDVTDDLGSLAGQAHILPLWYAAQSGEHYLRLVMNRLAPPAKWTVYIDHKLGSRNLEQHSPAITRHDTFEDATVVWETMTLLASRIRADPKREKYTLQQHVDDARRPERLQQAFIAKWGEPIPVQERTASVLLDLADTRTQGPFPTRTQIIGN